MSDPDDVLDRILQQSNNNDDEFNNETNDEMWQRELQDLQYQLKTSKRNVAEAWKAKTIRLEKIEKKRKLQLAKELPGAGAHTLPAMITDSNLWFQHGAEKKRKHRLATMKSSFDRFPEISKHMFKGSRRHNMSAKKATEKTKAWETNRLRRQLKRAARDMLECCDCSYVEATNKTKLDIEITRSSMATKILLKKLVPAASAEEGTTVRNNDSEFFSRYNSIVFELESNPYNTAHYVGDKSSGDESGGGDDGSLEMLKCLREKASFHEQETLRYSRGR
jgi:hypothetical protein